MFDAWTHDWCVFNGAYIYVLFTDLVKNINVIFFSETVTIKICLTLQGNSLNADTVAIKIFLTLLGNNLSAETPAIKIFLTLHGNNLQWVLHFHAIFE